MCSILYIALRGFYVEALRDRPGAKVILHENSVLDACAAAQRLGVRLGMGATEAKSLRPDAAFVKFQPDDYQFVQDRWLTRCTEASDCIEPGLPHEAWLDLGAHPEPILVAMKLLRSLARQMRLPLQAGLAATPWIAQKMAEFGPTLAPEDAENRLISDWVSWEIDAEAMLRTPAECIGNWPVDALPVEPAHQSRLRFLGYRTLADARKIPVLQLRSQFGLEGGLWLEQCLAGGGSRPLESQFPRDALADRVVFPHPVDTTEPLEFAMQLLAKRLGEQLAGRELQAHQIRRSWVMESGKKSHRDRTFMKAIQNERGMISVVRLLAEPFPDERVCELRVQLPSLEKAQRVQSAFSSITGDKPASASAAFHYVREVYGDQAVLRASEVEIPRRRRVLKAWAEATGWRGA